MKPRKYIRKDGSVRYLQNGVLSNPDGPAVILPTGRKEWWLDGKRHNPHGPAVAYPNRVLEWWVDGKRHNPHGPAAIYPDKRIEYWVNGKLHNPHGPAIIGMDGSIQWWVNGYPHNDKGPAMVRRDGACFWYREGCDDFIFSNKMGIWITAMVFSTVSHWDEYFLSGGDFPYTKRNSPQFKALCELWDQFKSQHKDYERDS
jgi:hypothetical protein